MPLPKSAVIVGGSLSGLLHGLYLKRHGSNVVILEQDSKNIRSSHNAGICFGPAAQEILSKYDDTGIQTSIPAVATRIAYRKRPDFFHLNIRRNNTSWGLLYRILRANFDGLASDAVPIPPSARKGDGKAEYLSGKKVTKLECHDTHSDGAVTVWFVDEKGKMDSLQADLVIGADGLHSTVRKLVEAPANKEYAGCVTWRGTVPENELSEEFADYFQRRITLNLLSRSYVVIYGIPRDEGSFEPGSRLINWVWYQNFSDNSPELTEILTDINGKTHANTVPVGLVQPEIWKRHLAAGIDSLAAPVAELIGKSNSNKVFVTKVNDAICDKAVYHGGRVILVGDALSTYRPHLAVAAEWASRHCLGLGKVWKGELTMDEWEKEATGNTTRIYRLSRVLGGWFLRGWGELLAALWVYLVALMSLKLGGDGRYLIRT